MINSTNRLQNCSCVSINITSNFSDCWNNSLCIQDDVEPLGQVIFYTHNTIILMHCLYVAVLLIGLIGNFLTCSVIMMRRSMRRSIHIYTCNLAVCDILLLSFFVVTQMIYMKDQLVWNMGKFMCKVNNVVVPVTLNTSILTLLVITIDRARGLIQPFQWRADSKKTAKILIPIIWLVSLLFNVPLFLYPKLAEHSDDGGVTFVTICDENWPNVQVMNVYWISIFVIMFALPLLIIIITHVVMFFVMNKDKNSIHRKHNKRMIRMVVALVIVFTVCTGFQHVNFFISTHLYKNLSLQDAGFYYSISNFFVCLQATLNPIIYGTLRQDFKRAFKNIIVGMMVNLKLQKRLTRRSQKSYMASKLLSTYVSSSYYEEAYRRETKRGGSRNTNQTNNHHSDSPLVSRNSFNNNGQYSMSSTPTSLLHSTLSRNLLSSYEHSYYDIEQQFGVTLVGYESNLLPDICTGLPTTTNSSNSNDTVPKLEDNNIFNETMKNNDIVEVVATSELVPELKQIVHDISTSNSEETLNTAYDCEINENKMLLSKENKALARLRPTSIFNDMKSKRFSAIVETLKNSPESNV